MHLPRFSVLAAACIVLLVLCSRSRAIEFQPEHKLRDAGWKASPPVWPDQFKATMFGNRTNRLQLVTLYYDWKLKANLNIIATQLGRDGTVWDLEWNNGTSFIFSRDEPVCKVMHFDVGILTPDWLAGSTHLGQQETDTFICDVWTKADFIRYYADVDSSKPVRWTFLGSGAQFHVLDYRVGEVLPKKLWQAPAYCFQDPPNSSSPVLDNDVATGHMMRLQAAQQVEAEVQQKQQQRKVEQQQQQQQQLEERVKAS